MARTRSGRVTRPVSSQKARLTRTRNRAVEVPLPTNLTTTARPKEFSDLPAEIRLKIWHTAVVPRLVSFPKTLTHDGRTLGRSPPPGGELRVWEAHIAEPQNKDVLPPGSNKTPLALLGACKESREEIKPLYREMFGFSMPVSDNMSRYIYKVSSREYKGVVFNPNIDVLLIGRGTVEDLFHHGPSNDLQELRYAALHVDDEMIFWSDGYTRVNKHISRTLDHLVALFIKCPKLQRLYMYLDDEQPDPYWDPRIERFKRILNDCLRDRILDLLPDWDEDEEGNVDPGKKASIQAVNDRWMEVAHVKFLREIKEELGAASTEMV